MSNQIFVRFFLGGVGRKIVLKNVLHQKALFLTYFSRKFRKVQGEKKKPKTILEDITIDKSPRRQQLIFLKKNLFFLG